MCHPVSGFYITRTRKANIKTAKDILSGWSGVCATGDRNAVARPSGSVLRPCQQNTDRCVGVGGMRTGCRRQRVQGAPCRSSRRRAIRSVPNGVLRTSAAGCAGREFEPLPSAAFSRGLHRDRLTGNPWRSGGFPRTPSARDLDRAPSARRFPTHLIAWCIPADSRPVRWPTPPRRVPRQD